MTDSPDFPEGWMIGEESYRFHRKLFLRYGRRTAHGEYSAILAQIRYRIAEQLDTFHFRVTMVDGTKIIVTGGWRKLNGVEYPDWIPKQKKIAAQPVAAAIPEPPPPEPVAAIPPPRRKLGLNTLTLGNPAGARALAARLQRMGVPLDLIGGAPPP
jgi:hypothetical protein